MVSEFWNASTNISFSFIILSYVSHLVAKTLSFRWLYFFYKKNIIYYTFMLKYDIIKTWRSRKMMQKDNEEHQ
ncbi:hypothetical protein CH336_00245 [Mycoplasmopsis bovis]|nr:hypothetical protein CH320_00245 [Mycoplasmopsis bovis]AXJ73027.1 hypothetical protein CH336_00245 [Mycoplasmopsis bovis]